MASPLKIGCSYFGNYHLRHVKTDLVELKEIGFNTLTIPLSENDLQFYKQTVAEIVTLGKEMDFEISIDPWGIGKVFGGEAYSWFVAKYPSECQILEEGSTVPYACPNSRSFREYLSEWLHFASSTQADYILWDEPHLYIPGWAGETKGTWACHCRTCQKSFRNLMGYKLPKTINEDVRTWQITVLLELLSKLNTLTTHLGKKNQIILMPNAEDKPGGISWERLGELEHLSIFGTDPYWIWDKKDMASYVREYSRKVFDICQNHSWEPQIWLQAMKIPAGKENEMVQAMGICQEEGIRNISFWGYDCCRHISYARCDNPDVAWKVLCQGIKDIQAPYR